MSDVEGRKVMTVTLLGIVLLLLGLAALGAWCDRLVPLLAIAVVLGMVLASHLDRLDVQTFTWVKLGSLVPLTVLLAVLPRLPARFWRVATILLSAAICLNIVEAVVQDALRGHWANAAIGLTLAATVPGSAAWYIGRPGTRAGARFALRWPWILAYTAWNLGFVIMNYSARTGDHIAVLLAPILVAAVKRDPHRYAIARVFTLFYLSAGVVSWIDALRWPWLPALPSIAAAYPLIVSGGAALAGWNLVDRFRRGPARVTAETGVLA
jgi:hypothetical protein